VYNPGIGIQAEALMWSYQVTGLWLVFHPLSIRLVGIVRWGKTELVQGCQCCCFCHTTVVLPFSCISVYSAPPPARRDNSVLNAALWPRDQLLDPPTALLWEVGLVPHPYCQPLCLSHPLLGPSGSSGRLACHPTPTFSLFASPDLSRLFIP
jgi:hypothetical protein